MNSNRNRYQDAQSTMTSTAGSESATQRPLPPLIAALYRHAAIRREGLPEMAAQLGVTTGYILQLRDGTRLPERISREFAEAVAHYLGVSAITVQLLAGKIQARDFITPIGARSLLESELDRMCLDAELGALMPERLLDAHEDVQHFVVLLYQEAKQQLARSQRRLPLVLDEVLRGALLQEDMLMMQSIEGGE